jgi:16S rRNA (guanine(966)-N(2))-methyltransferase RsmD
MRIIGGKYRSRSIAMPKGTDIRPTQDKVREAIFNILGDITGKTVLELFAGSGALGIEALSRDASHVTFVDNNQRCLSMIRSNLGSLEAANTLYDIIRCDALSSPARLAGKGLKYDIIFADPPYYKDMAKKCLINIDACDIVSPNGVVLMEHFKKDALDARLERLLFVDERRYGDTVVTFYARRNTHDA